MWEPSYWNLWIYLYDLARNDSFNPMSLFKFHSDPDEGLAYGHLLSRITSNPKYFLSCWLVIIMYA